MYCSMPFFERALRGEGLIEVPAERLGESLGPHRLAEGLRPDLDPLVQERLPLLGELRAHPALRRRLLPDLHPLAEDGAPELAEVGTPRAGAWGAGRLTQSAHPRLGAVLEGLLPDLERVLGRVRRGHLGAPSMPRCVMTREALRRRTCGLPEPRSQPVRDPRPAVDGGGAPRDQGDVAPGQLEVALVRASDVVDQRADASGGGDVVLLGADDQERAANLPEIDRLRLRAGASPGRGGCPGRSPCTHCRKNSAGNGTYSFAQRESAW